MHKNITSLIFSLSLVFLIIGVFYNISQVDINNLGSKYKEEIKINENTFQVEIVSGKEKTGTGLSYRESMCDACGMLFIFEKEDNYAFWMKDMNYDLDIIFIDSNKKIVEIHSNVKKDGYNKAEPNSSEKIRNIQKVKYVLELNAGKAESKNIRTGDTVSF